MHLHLLTSNLEQVSLPKGHQSVQGRKNRFAAIHDLKKGIARAFCVRDNKEIHILVWRGR